MELTYLNDAHLTYILSKKLSYEYKIQNRLKSSSYLTWCKIYYATLVTKYKIKRRNFWCFDDITEYNLCSELYFYVTIILRWPKTSKMRFCKVLSKYWGHVSEKLEYTKGKTNWMISWKCSNHPHNGSWKSKKLLITVPFSKKFWQELVVAD